MLETKKREKREIQRRVKKKNKRPDMKRMDVDMNEDDPKHSMSPTRMSQEGSLINSSIRKRSLEASPEGMGSPYHSAAPNQTSLVDRALSQDEGGRP